jgi:hypothetical protein
VLGFAFKAGLPLIAAAGLLAHSSAGLAAGPIGLTDVTGKVGDCTAPVSNGVCAPLFDGHQLLWPGEAPQTATVAIGYHGQAPAALALYVSDFTARAAGSGPSCTASDPAAKLDLRIVQAGSLIYSGTLSDLAGAHHDAPTALPLQSPAGSGGSSWHPGDSSTFTFSVGLDASADNAYMGCVTTAGLTWVAG